MFRKSIVELSSALQARKISCVELTKLFLERIHALADELNCFITVTEQLALEQARAADHLIATSAATPLTGIPMVHKDLFCTQGVKTTCGSRMLDNFIAPYDATIVQRVRQAGMVMLGKTNMDEFAMGSSNENSHYGAVKNPWDKERVPGGSSGGSAAAVAARLAPLATGTDTGGSVRQPASFCGITGLKPTYGRVSRYGMVAFASSLDQAGLLAQTAEDIAPMLSLVAGYDDKDSTSVDRPVDNYANHLSRNLGGLKVGIVKEHMGTGLDPGIAKNIEAALATLEGMGAVLREVSLPNIDLAVPTYYVVALAECSSNLSRYDGVRFGYRAADPVDLEDLYKRSRSEGFGAEVKRRIMIGTYALSAGYYDAYYLKAQQLRRLIRDDFQQQFEQVDVLMGPTAPSVAFRLGEKSDDAVTMYLSDIFTTAVNLAGLPAISVPAGFHQGLPVGLQVIGNYFCEAQLLNVAHQFQTNTAHHLRLPPALDG